MMQARNSSAQQGKNACWFSFSLRHQRRRRNKGTAQLKAQAAGEAKPDTEGKRPRQLSSHVEIVNGQRVTVRVFEPRPASEIDTLMREARGWLP